VRGDHPAIVREIRVKRKHRTFETYLVLQVDGCSVVQEQTDAIDAAAHARIVQGGQFLSVNGINAAVVLKCKSIVSYFDDLEP
jgi:hypothetical protein